MEFIFKKVSQVVFRYYKAIVIAFILLTVISLITVFNMEIKTDIIDVLPKDNKIVIHFKDIMQKYGVLDTITVVVESESKTIEDHTDLIETIADKLKRSPLIEYVDYSPSMVRKEFFLKYFPFFLDENGLKQLRERLSKDGIERQISLNRQKLILPLSSPMDSELITRDPLNINEIIIGSLKNLHKDDGIDLSAGYYFTKDHSAALIFAKPKGKSRDMEFVKKFKKELDVIIDSSLKENNNPSGIKIRPTGAHILSEEVRQVIRHDIISSSVLSVISIGLLIWIAYRVRLAVLVSIGLTMLASLSMTLAFAYLLFGSLNIVTSIVAAILIGLYVDYSMHMLKRYGDELRELHDQQKALEVTLTKTGKAIVISAITTSLSFFSILITKFEGLYELGIVSGIGVLLCLVTSLLLMSSLLIWISMGGSEKVLSIRRLSSGGERMIALIGNRPRLILISGALILVFLGLGMTRLNFDNDPEHIGAKESKAIAALQAINQKINKKGDPLQIVIKGKNMEDLTASFDSLETLLFGWKRDGLIKQYDSLNVFLPAPHTQRINIERLKDISGKDTMQINKIEKILTSALDKNNLEYNKNYINKYITGIIAALNRHKIIGLEELKEVLDPKVSHFYNKDDMSLAAYIYPPDRGWDKKVLSTIRGAIASAGPNWTLTGKLILFDEIKSSIIWGSTLATVAALLMNILVIYWFFRKSRYVLLVMLPVTLGFLLTLGIMGLLKAPFNFINVGTVCLIFGLGVDYGVYVMQAYLGEERRDVSNALRITGKNVMMCAATTVAGCGSLITAKFIGISTIGFVLTIGTISCAAIALLFLPAILYLKEDSLQNERF